RLRRLRVLAEARDDAAASLVDDVEAAREPHDEHESHEDPGAAERQYGAAPAAAGRRLVARARLALEQVVEPPVDVAPDLVEIRRSAGTAFTPLGIVQRHEGLGQASSVAPLVRRRERAPLVYRLTAYGQGTARRARRA